ncbi:Ionotropic receptor 76b [Carabus blaptoides fortunei]
MAGQELILTTVLSIVFNNISFDSTQVGEPNRLLRIEEMAADLKDQHLVIATTQNYPLSYAVLVNGTLVGDGVAFSFVKLLQDKYGFRYSVVVPDEDIMGTGNTGIFGVLNSGKADLAAAFLPVVPDGQQVIKYSRNLDTGEFVVLMKRPKESAQGSGLLAPFTLGVWLLILISLIAVGPIIYLLILLRHWLCPIDEKNKTFPLPSCVWFVYGALLKQGSTLSPVSDSARLLFATWWIFITILTAFYTANLTAFLTLSQFTLPIQKAEDIQKYNWVTRKGNAVEHAAMDIEETNTRAQHGQFVTDNNTEILDYYVKKKEYLFIMEKPIVDHLMYGDYLDKSRKGIPESDRCTFVITSWSVITRARAFAYNMNFKWKEVFDHTLQYLVEAGIIKYRLQEGLPNTEICPLNLNSKERQLQNSDLWTTIYEQLISKILKMSLTIQQMISDAKKLAGRLKDDENVADVLLNETHAINKKIDAMKQFQEEVEVLNEVARQRPHSQLIANIQQENRHLREIQHENRELRAALEEHQTALEHIMSKYRQHTSQQLTKSRIDFKSLQEKRYSEMIKQQAEKIQEMAAVMNEAALLDEKNASKDMELLTRLKTENKGLRELLEISCKFGSLGKQMMATTMEDKDVQTDKT